MKKLIALITLACGLAVFAQENTALFNAKEVTLDVGATYTVAQPNGFGQVFNHNDISGGKWGINFGTSYWLSRYVGMGVGAGIFDADRPGDALLDYTEFNLMLRMPLGHIAPYGLAGGGRDFDKGRYSTHIGAGLEFRATSHIGAFAESRYTFEANSPDLLSFRSGLRWAF